MQELLTPITWSWAKPHSLHKTAFTSDISSKFESTHATNTSDLMVINVGVLTSPSEFNHAQKQLIELRKGLFSLFQLYYSKRVQNRANLLMKVKRESKS